MAVGALIGHHVCFMADTLRESLHAVRVLRASGVPGDVARPLIVAAHEAAGSRAPEGWSAAVDADPWGAHLALELALDRHVSPAVRALRWSPAAALLLGAVLAGLWGFRVWLARPAWDEGLDARYHTRIGLAGAAVTRRDATLEHGWGRGSPLPELPVDRFSIVWRGCIATDRSRWLHAGADDGIRIQLDGVQVFERWGPNGFALLPAGEVPPGVHRIRVEFEELGGFATTAVKWSDRPDGPPETIAASALVPVGGNRRHPCPL